MSAKEWIRNAAAEIAENVHHEIKEKKKQLADIEVRKAQIESDLNSANLSFDRLKSFQPDIGGDLQCPKCWIMHETKSSLSPVPSETRDDLFRECALEIEIPA